MQTIWQDIRYAVRGLRRSPGFALTALLSLVLGIGASLAIFTVTDNLLLRPLPYRDPSRLMMVWEAHKLRAPNSQNVISPANYLDWKRQNTVFESMAIFSTGRAVLVEGSRSEELGRQVIGADLLPMLGVQPLRGRAFTAADELPASEPAVLISHRIWQNWFGGDAAIVGRKLMVSSTPVTVLGVMPAGFYFRNRDIDLWQPAVLDPARDYRKTAGRFMMAAGRVKPGVTRDQAQANMATIAQRLEADYPAFDTNWTVNVEPLRDSLVREVKASLWVLLGAVGLLLAVACANVANLLLARYTARAREMAIRLSLGASRARVVRQLLTESVLLGLAGGLLGVLAARAAVTALLAFAPRDLVRNTEFAVDLRIVLFAIALALLTGILFGLAPAFLGARAGLMTGMRAGGRAITGGGRLRAWLVGAEVALSVILLVGATLLFRSFVGLQAVKPGLDAANVLTFRVQIPGAKYQDTPARTRFFARAVEQIGQLPGVQSTSAVSYLPFTGQAAATYVDIGGRPTAKTGEELVATIRTVLPGYFRTMGIPLKEGRDFAAADNAASAPPRFIVNEAFVARFLQSLRPLGTRLSVKMSAENPFGEIIGVTADVKEGSLDKEPAPTVYYVHANLVYTGMTIVVRAHGNPLSLAEPVRQVIRSLDTEQPISEVRTMEDIVADTFSRQRFSALLLSGFSMTALLLAAIGIYGVLAYSVTERTREIGVRVALGAAPGRIVGLVIRSGAVLVAGGTAAGIAGALALTSLLKGLLFGIGPRDTATFIAVPVILALVALLAAYIPARRAAKLEPMDALRAE